MKVLFYVPITEKSPDIEGLIPALIAEGYTVYILNQTKGGGFNSRMAYAGAITSSYSVSPRLGILFYIVHAIKLIIYCKKYRIDLMYSHLETCNTIAVLSKYFLKTKVVIVRHHVNAIQLLNSKNSIIHKLTYRYASHIIAISERARHYMIHEEAVSRGKIELIRLGINFSQYPSPSLFNTNKIREKYKADVVDVLLLSVGRLLASKRHDISIRLVKRLVDRGLQVRLIILGRGPEISNLSELIDTLALKDNVYIVGYVDNVLDYMLAADFLVHPSVLDSSSLTVKEAGLVRLPVIVCRGVGDFEDIIIDRKNGYLMEKDNPLRNMEEIVLSTTEEEREIIGAALQCTILEMFSIENVMPSYREFHRKLFTERFEEVTQKNISGSLT